METYNKYQTQLTDELLASLPKEVVEQLFEFINTVPFIHNCIREDRKRAKDLQRDKQGRIIVDVTKPHILENMDYFRQAAIFYQKNKCYTFLKPNPNPNSEYGKWIRQERDRCWNGMVRESDGEWVTGYMYFYLNYFPIVFNKQREKSKIADRVIDFGEVWEGVYYAFHYIDQMRNGGIYNDFKGGQHGAELARRMASKSYMLGSIAAHNFILGENSQSCKKVNTIITASKKEYLTKDGTLNKFMSAIDFTAENTQFPRRRLKESIQEMVWTMGYKDAETNINHGTQNSVLGVAADEEGKMRGKRGHILVDEFGCHLKGTKVLMFDGTTKNVEDIKKGDLLMGDDNTSRTVLKLFSGIDDMYKITLRNGDTQIVNSNHLVYYKKVRYDNTAPKYIIKKAKDLYNENIDSRYKILKSKVQFSEKELLLNPYLLGLWLGNGDKTGARIAVSNNDVLDWLLNNYDASVQKLKNTDKCVIINIRGIRKDFKHYGLVNCKFIPDDFKINSPDNQLKLIAGFCDTDGNYVEKKDYIEICQSEEHYNLLLDLKFMCQSLGLKCTMDWRISGEKTKKPNIKYWRLRISGDIDIIPTLKHHIRKRPITQKSKNNWLDNEFKIEEYGKGEYYGFLVDKNNLFLLDDFTVVHNSFPGLSKMYNVWLPCVQEGDITFAMIFLVGTAGDKESDFQGASELMYNPNGYNLYALPNVYDKEGSGKRQFVYFFPAYINRKGCYDHDGNSDVIKALIEILMNRWKVKHNSSDPFTIVKTIAEQPITPAEAILKTGVNIFPVTDLANRLGQLDNEPNLLNEIYVGTLVQNGDKIEFKPNGSTPIRDYPLKNALNTDGAIEIFTMPEINKQTGKVFGSRYIASLDPYENDQSDESTSLGSLFVLDLFTDNIVCEYTGRPMFSEDFYENCRKICLFYNAVLNFENNKKGVFAYFSKMNCLYLLSDTLDYLKDKMLVKCSTFGNTSKGTTATKPINDYAKTLIRNWLLNPTTFNSFDADGNPIETIMPHLYTLRTRALIKELMLYNPVGNFDRISSLGMLMLLREDRMVLGGGEIRRTDEVEKDYLGNDDFFTRNYDKRFKKTIEPFS